MQRGLDLLPVKTKRSIFGGWQSPYELTSIQAGEVEAVHQKTIENFYAQQLVKVEGQTDILTMGLPYICPYNVNSIMNPILVMCLGLGYFFNLYKGRPLVREGGVVIMSHPTPWEFHPVHHPSYIDFFEQVLPETTDPVEIEQRYEKQFAEDEWYIHLYRNSYAYHGVHPLYMWYWGSHAMDHLVLAVAHACPFASVKNDDAEFVLVLIAYCCVGHVSTPHTQRSFLSIVSSVLTKSKIFNSRYSDPVHPTDPAHPAHVGGREVFQTRARRGSH